MSKGELIKGKYMFILSYITFKIFIKDVEAVVHAGCQDEILSSRTEPDPPDSSSRPGGLNGAFHLPSVPQQQLLIVAVKMLTDISDNVYPES
jgi:hypothetical protein